MISLVEEAEYGKDGAREELFERGSKVHAAPISERQRQAKIGSEALCIAEGTVRLDSPN